MQGNPKGSSAIQRRREREEQQRKAQIELEVRREQAAEELKVWKTAFPSALVSVMSFWRVHGWLDRSDLTTQPPSTMPLPVSARGTSPPRISWHVQEMQAAEAAAALEEERANQRAAAAAEEAAALRQARAAREEDERQGRNEAAAVEEEEQAEDMDGENQQQEEEVKEGGEVQGHGDVQDPEGAGGPGVFDLGNDGDQDAQMMAPAAAAADAADNDDVPGVPPLPDGRSRRDEWVQLPRPAATAERLEFVGELPARIDNK